jgi:hypothetical protein
VLVLVLVLVDTVVLVLGVVVVVVVGLSVVVVVVGDVSVVVLGCSVWVTVSVPPVGTGATEAPDEVGDAVVLDVVDVELEPSPPVSETMAYTITAITMTLTAPMLTRPGAVRYQGVGGSGGGG